MKLGSESGDLSLILLHPVLGHGSFMGLLKTELSPVDSIVIFHVYVHGPRACRYEFIHAYASGYGSQRLVLGPSPITLCLIY